MSATENNIFVSLAFLKGFHSLCKLFFTEEGRTPRINRSSVLFYWEHHTTGKTRCYQRGIEKQVIHPTKQTKKSKEALWSDSVWTIVAGDYVEDHNSDIISQCYLISILTLCKASSQRLTSKSHTSRFLQHSILAHPQLNQKRENLQKCSSPIAKK